MANRRLNTGVAALPMILLISAIIIEIAVISVVLATTLNNTRFSERLGAEALSAARAGAQDTILKVIREKGCPASLPQLTVGSRSANITCTDSGGGVITIQSTGKALSREKRVQVVLGVDSVTGEVSLQSFKEISL